MRTGATRGLQVRIPHNTKRRKIRKCFCNLSEGTRLPLRVLDHHYQHTHPTSPLIADAGADWIADTGATSHMTPHRHWFSDYKPHKTAIRLADNTIIYSVGIGSVKFAPAPVNSKPQRLLLFENVLHVPQLRSNLLSVLYLTRQKEYTVIVQSDSMSFKRAGTVLFTASVTKHNAAVLDGKVIPLTDFAGLVSTCPLDTSLWHRRFCHLNKGDVHKLVHGDLVHGLPSRDGDRTRGRGSLWGSTKRT